MILPSANSPASISLRRHPRCDPWRQQQTMVLADARVASFELRISRPCSCSSVVFPLSRHSQHCRLLIDSPDLEIRAMSARVKSPLRIWKWQSYLKNQR